MDATANPIAYRFPRNVTHHFRSDAVILVKRFPLKSIRLHPIWEPVFHALASGRWITLDQIQDQCARIDPDKLDFFFHDLLLKGFLEQRGNRTINRYPFVSVIIPVKNRPEEIQTCLESLLLLDYPTNKLEIIVVDDASDDHTPAVVRQFNTVRLISLETHQNAPYCRNRGASEARGELLAFIDSDCTADPAWLSDLTVAFRDPRVGAVGGRIDGFFTTSRLDRYEQVNSSLIIGTHIKRSSDADRFFYVPSCNLLVKSDLFLELAGFNPDLFVGEDVDLCWRIQNAGQAVEYRPSGTVFHRHRNQISAFCRRRFDYGMSEPMLQRLHPERAKKWYFPVGGFFFWWFVLISCLISPLFLIFCPVIFLADSLAKHVKTLRLKIPVSLWQNIKAVARTNAVLFHHCAGFISRYYLIWVLPISALSPGTGLSVFCLHLFSGSMAYGIKKPKMNGLIFIFYFTLDQISYQTGVWVGALRYRSIRAIAPSLTFQK